MGDNQWLENGLIPLGDTYILSLPGLQLIFPRFDNHMYTYIFHHGKYNHYLGNNYVYHFL